MNTRKNDPPWMKFDQVKDHCNSDKPKGWDPAMIRGHPSLRIPTDRQWIRLATNQDPTMKTDHSGNNHIASEPEKWIGLDVVQWPSYW